MYFAPAGTIAFNRYGCPLLMVTFKFACKWAVSVFYLSSLLIFKFAYNWAVSKKLVTGFDQILVGGIRIYLFGSYLLF